MKKKAVKKSEKLFPEGSVLSMLESMNEGIQLLAEQHGGIVSRLDGLDGRLDGIDGRLDKLQDDVTDIKYTLTTKADRSEVEKLDKRITKVERAVFSKKA